jgi:RimJ/RimL family protein N-acetyltransferase
MSITIRKISEVSDAEAQKMFQWETDPEYKFYCGPCKGPESPPRFQKWQDLKSHVNQSSHHRFGIYSSGEFIGEISFVFDHPVLIKRDPKTAWIGIGIGDTRHRGKGAGTLAMQTVEHAVRVLGGRRIELGVFSFNDPAIKFYQKLGYQRFSEIADFTWWNGKWWSDLRFEKYL